MMIFRRTVVGIRRLRKVPQRRLLAMFALLLVAVRSVLGSNCVRPAKDADTVRTHARSCITRCTSSSVLFGVKKGNVMQPTVEWELEQLILSHLVSNFNIRFVETVSKRWSSVAVLQHSRVLCVAVRFD